MALNVPIEDLVKAHKHSSCHKEEVESSESCVCFYCARKFSPKDIVEWIEEKRIQKRLKLPTPQFTATCPFCGIDSVIGSASGLDLTDNFIKAMSEYWFGKVPVNK